MFTKYRSIVVQHVDLTCTCHRHTLITACSPPVESEGGVQVACRFTVVTADEVGVLVNVRASCIAECTPADSVEVG